VENDGVDATPPPSPRDLPSESRSEGNDVPVDHSKYSNRDEIAHDKSQLHLLLQLYNHLVQVLNSCRTFDSVLGYLEQPCKHVHEYHGSERGDERNPKLFAGYVFALLGEIRNFEWILGVVVYNGNAEPKKSDGGDEKGPADVTGRVDACDEDHTQNQV